MAIAPKLQARQSHNPLLERGTGDENRRGEHIDASAETALGDISVDTPAATAGELDAPASAIDSEATIADIAIGNAVDVGGTVDWSKAGSGGSFNGTSDYNPAENKAADKTLSEVLNEQLALAIHDPRDRLIGRNLIDCVDENGYLRADQTFEPTGVFARSLQECLTLQLKERGQHDQIMQDLLEHLELLAKHDLAKLRRICGVDQDTLALYIMRLKSLAPKPGLIYGGDMAAVVEPDVFIRETPQGGWSVELNSDNLPRVLVNNRYFSEVCKLGADEETKTFMTECHQNAHWLVKSLDQRARTILKVTTEIIKQQDGFFAYGVDHLRPLNLRTVADAIEMHESTVSRVTSNKFMSTPRGMFELKYFFTASIPALDGGEAHSAEVVRHKIKILISEETANSVTSDDKIVDLLRAQGIDIARRTVAKYRESMNIPSSIERRRIFKNKA